GFHALPSTCLPSSVFRYAFRKSPVRLAAFPSKPDTSNDRQMDRRFQMVRAGLPAGTEKPDPETAGRFDQDGIDNASPDQQNPRILKNIRRPRAPGLRLLILQRQLRLVYEWVPRYGNGPHQRRLRPRSGAAAERRFACVDYLLKLQDAKPSPFRRVGE